MKNELIKIENKNGQKTVSARELHKGLEIGRDFTTWVKGRIDKYDFAEGVDFTRVSLIHQNGGIKGGDVKSVDYALTLDMAKELCMVENNEQGRQIRRYFIECEKQLTAIVKSQPKLTREQELALKIIDKKADANDLLEYKEIVQLKSIDGNNLVLTCSQVVQQLKFNIPNLTTQLLHLWLADVMKLGSYEKFGDEKKRTFQPNDRFSQFVSGEGYALTGETTATSKATLYYTSHMVARIVKQHMGSLIEFVNAKTIGNGDN